MPTDVEQRLANKVAIVTGAGRGMGRAISVRFAREGADIAAVEVNHDTLQEVAEEVQEQGRKCLPIQADLSRLPEIDGMVKATLQEFGKIDILVNNAGVTKALGLFEITEVDWDWMHGINLRGLFFCLQSVAREMARRKQGKIINIASIAGKGYPGTSNAAYAASKGGVIALTKVAAQLLGPDNINVNAICPGITRTDMFQRLATERARQRGVSIEEVVKGREETIPIRRSNTPDDIAMMAVFLASDEAANVTGQAINVDGGLMP
jgi:NAD(P)-dependent dehydrogenase (short-subunit alcohol dehydrogenase family)